MSGASEPTRDAAKEEEERLLRSLNRKSLRGGTVFGSLKKEPTNSPASSLSAAAAASAAPAASSPSRPAGEEPAWKRRQREQEEEKAAQAA